MDFFDYLPNRGVLQIPDLKVAIPTVLEFMVKSKIILFDKRVAYLDCKNYWRRADDDVVGDCLKHLVGFDKAALLSESTFDAIIRKMKSLPELRVNWQEQFRKHEYEVNLKNGIFDIHKKELKTERSEHLFTYILNASYISNCTLDKAPHFKKYVETSIGIENYECVMRIIGCVLSSLTKGRKAFVFQGKGGTGKSTLLNWLEQVIGEQFVSREPFHSMGSLNSLARYVDKRVNISRENGVTPMRNEDGFKSLVSCEGITGRDVYSRAVSYVPTTKFIFASNHDLCFQHPDDAVWDRLIVILFNRTIAERDLNLYAKLYAERDIIVSLALDTLKDLVESGYDFKESPASKKYIELKRKEIHAPEYFLKECCELRQEGTVSKRTLLRAYEKWSEANSFSPVSRNELYDVVRQYSKLIIERKVDDAGQRVRGFSGITLKRNKAEREKELTPEMNNTPNAPQT